jgi:hypothetical protein
MPIGADDSISVIVTPLVLSVTADVETVNYGTLPYSTDNSSRSTEESPLITVTNNGSVASHIELRGANATAQVGGQDNWTLSCDPSGLGVVAQNQFVHKFGAGNVGDWNAGGIATLCSDSTKRLASNVIPTRNADFTLQFAMPTGTNGFGPRSSSVTVIAVAPTP